MKKRTNKLWIAILFLAGFSLLLYPLVANEWNNYRQKKLIGIYEEEVAAKEAAGTIDYAAEKQAAVDYNNALLPSILPDSFANVKEPGRDEAYMSCLNIIGTGVMGTIEIPKIDITLPVFHTTEEDVLETAAGHLEGSSLPVGGKSTHAVISAHRGLPSAALFTDLDKMEKKDHFLLHILDETLCYEVDQISTVVPEDTKDLEVEDGKDLVTLLTCTPYGVNSHRLLVRGHRVPYEPELLADEKIPLGNMSLHTNYLLWVVVGILVTVVFCIFLYRRERRLAVKSLPNEAPNPDESGKPKEEPKEQAPIASGGDGEERKEQETDATDREGEEPKEPGTGEAGREVEPGVGESGRTGEEPQVQELDDWLKAGKEPSEQELDDWLKESRALGEQEINDWLKEDGEDASC